MWEVEGRGGSRASLCPALPSSWRSQKPVWWVNTALERLWIQQGFPSLKPGWRTAPCLSDLGLPAQALVLVVHPRPPSTINGGFWQSCSSQPLGASVGNLGHRRNVGKVDGGQLLSTADLHLHYLMGQLPQQPPVTSLKWLLCRNRKLRCGLPVHPE